MAFVCLIPRRLPGVPGTYCVVGVDDGRRGDVPHMLPAVMSTAATKHLHNQLGAFPEGCDLGNQALVTRLHQYLNVSAEYLERLIAQPDTQLAAHEIDHACCVFDTCLYDRV